MTRMGSTHSPLLTLQKAACRRRFNIATCTLNYLVFGYLISMRVTPVGDIDRRTEPRPIFPDYVYLKISFDGN